MTKRMLIDATHAEETRVVVLDGNRLEDFDVETAGKKQLKGNIYLAKVVRVEPSLQAAFVEYGGGRHGFLAFGEIHPDYYQIPVADRQRLLALQEEEARAEEEAEDAAAEAAEAAGEPAHYVEEIGREPPDTDMGAEPDLPMEEMSERQQEALALAVDQEFLAAREEAAAEPLPDNDFGVDSAPEMAEPAALDASAESAADPARSETAEPVPSSPLAGEGEGASETPEAGDHPLTNGLASDSGTTPADHPATELEVLPPAPPPETIGGHTGENGHDDGDNGHDRREARPPARFLRSYKIQEVIRRRQILLVQVVKEERGTKGAALTTYISLAGRFSVLMPNSPRGGGISRKITSAADRRRLKEITAEMQIPRGMGLIVRTAGANRPKAEIRRDCEYLLELWDNVRETTMQSVAPALIHEEASLIKRAIRDNYSRDVEEVVVDGEAGWRAARDFMRMLMPAHARKVIKWHDSQPLFAKHGVEAQLDAMMQPVVQLRSGGYLVINQTEALVAIDVNSGRSTRERGIEETALKTNLEAADEVARQLRLRDLAGLIVIDFIDMESRRNNAAVEKRLKDALKEDRARIQLGSISHFGLLELSRQRLRPSLAESNFVPCPHCGGTGHVRTTETAALAVLRAVEEEGAKRRAAAIVVHVAGAIALYVLNHKRARLAEIEARYGMTVTFAADESLLPPQTRIERIRPQIDPLPIPAATPLPAAAMEEDEFEEEADVETEEDDTEEVAASESGGEKGEGRRRKRRRRRGGKREDATGVDPASLDQPEIEPIAAAEAALEPAPMAAPAEAAAEEENASTDAASEEERAGRRRGRRGGRRRRREGGEGEPVAAEAETEAPASFDAPPAYRGPTPADPFGGQAFDIFDIMDEEVRLAPPAPPVPEPPPTMEAAPAEAPLLAEQPASTAVEPAPEAAIAPATAAAIEAPPASIQTTLAAIEEPAVLEEEPPLLNGHAVEPTIEAVTPDSDREPAPSLVPPPILVGSVPVADKKRGWWRR